MATDRKLRKESKLKRFFKAPLKILSSARDFYMKGLNEYSDQVYVMSCPTGQANYMPRSYSVSTTKSNHFDDDYRELLRAASTRSGLGRSSMININMDDIPARRQQYSYQNLAAKEAENFPRSHSVAIGRIDEETSSDFAEEAVKVKTDHVYPRSRSHAVSKRNAPDSTRAF